MKKILIVFAILSICHCISAQTRIYSSKQRQGIMESKLVSNGDTVGIAYSFAPEAYCEIVFNPTDTISMRSKLCIPGYITDKKHKPNGWIFSKDGKIVFATFPDNKVTAISVYKIVNNNRILDSAKTIKYWRFLVEQKCITRFNDSMVEKSTNIYVVDLNRTLSLYDACRYIQGLQKDKELFADFSLTCVINACLLTTEPNRIYLKNGVKVDEDALNVEQYKMNQNNVLIVR